MKKLTQSFTMVFITVAVLWSVLAISVGLLLLHNSDTSFFESLGELLSVSGKERVSAPANMSPAARIDVIDVGQGSSMLVHLLDKNAAVKSILIDAGDTFASNNVCRVLENSKIKQLDLLIITHQHTDHFGGAVKVLENYQVSELWMPDIPDDLLPTNVTYSNFLKAAEQNGCEVKLKSAPEQLTLSDVSSLSLLDGFTEDLSNLNNSSLCLRFELGDFSLLVTGDGETEVEETLLQNKAEIDSDIFIAGHHGSNTSNKQSFLNEVSPLASVISVGRDNEYDLPNTYAVGRLSNFGSVYRTDINSTVTIFTDGSTIAISFRKTTDFLDAGRRP